MESGDQLQRPRPAVLAATAQWLVLAKPAGWLTIPGRQTDAPVLSEWVEREQGRSWVVHRLDRETSGVVLFARTAEAHRQASLWFQRHEVRKAYDFLAHGALHVPTVRIQFQVEGAPSVTQVERRESFAGCFLGRAVPMTGRRHQIRIHLSGQGHALLGDPTYGGHRSVPLPGEGGELEVRRVALHAARLELPTREVFEASWPMDFASWVARLREAKAHAAGK